MLQCPLCKTTLATGRLVCDGCSVLVRVDTGRAVPVVPDVRPAALLASWDLVRTRPVGVSAGAREIAAGIRVSMLPEGQLVELADGQAYRSNVTLVRRRDICVRASFVPYDPSVDVSLMVRCELMGKASTSYTLCFSARRGAARLNRRVGSKQSYLTPLTDWMPAPIPPVGQLMDVELRAFGSSLEGLVAGRRILAVHDPVLGVGHPGALVEALGGSGRCLWRGLELREVAV